MRLEGWLLDLYSSQKGMVVWLKTSDGRAMKLVDDYRPTIYVHGSPRDMKKLESSLASNDVTRQICYAEKRVRLCDYKKSKVLKIEVTAADEVLKLAKEIVRLGRHKKYQLFNVDVPPARAYLYERDLFPLAKVQLGEGLKLNFDLIDSVESNDYELPSLKSMWLEVEPQRKWVTQTFNDPVESISISLDGDEGIIQDGDETDKLLSLVDAVREVDPDLVFTRGGDSWLIPYLAKRAEANGISGEMVLGREREPVGAARVGGKSYFSYGRIYYKPSARYLLGRIHIDVDNSFVYEECGLEGLVELSRLTRLPLQEMVRSSIGSAMSSLQLYAATKNDVLIPWAKREPEEFKTALELLEADRGGFILEPKVGVYEGVGEIDFGSFYPTMMEKYNISPETVLCKCCPNSKVRVLGMGYNICERRKGLIPQVLGQVLRKRSEYKRRMKEGCDLQLREVYNRRQSALKWILVTCFGYLGYKNARFGRIEAHESVTAFARENLIRAVKISEARGFEVIHGMVDSLWVRKSGASNPELISLCRDIERETSLPVSFEGLYSWIVFLPSRVRPAVPALNRFYGVLSDGGLKARGILMRCKDTPKLIRRFQANALEEMSKAKGVGEIGGRVDGVIRIARKYARDLMLGKVRVDDLAICRQISRHPLDYEAEAHTAIAARQMFESGIHLQPGQTVAYVVTEAGARNPNLRLKALLLAATNYDKNWYLNLLVTAAEELLGPLGYARDTIAELLLSKTKQVEL